MFNIYISYISYLILVILYFLPSLSSYSLVWYILCIIIYGRFLSSINNFVSHDVMYAMLCYNIESIFSFFFYQNDIFLASSFAIFGIFSCLFFFILRMLVWELQLRKYWTRIGANSSKQQNKDQNQTKHFYKLNFFGTRRVVINYYYHYHYYYYYYYYFYSVEELGFLSHIYKFYI